MILQQITMKHFELPSCKKDKKMKIQKKTIKKIYWKCKKMK